MVEIGTVSDWQLWVSSGRSPQFWAVPLASIGAAMPPRIAGTDLSDHSSFWQFGYPGALVTDTNYLRTAHYHRATDSPEKLNYEVLAVAVDGLAVVIADLAGSDTASTD